MTTTTRVRMVCPKCGGDDVTRDGVCRWSEPDQCWELAGKYDSFACDRCGELKGVEAKELTAAAEAA